MPTLLNTCGDCIQLEFNVCEDFVIDAGLTASTDYWLFVSNTLDNHWRIQLTTDSEGKLTVPYAAFPATLFSYGAGLFTLEVKENVDDTEVVDLVIDSKTYKCMSFGFVPMVQLETPVVQ